MIFKKRHLPPEWSSTLPCCWSSLHHPRTCHDDDDDNDSGDDNDNDGDDDGDDDDDDVLPVPT